MLSGTLPKAAKCVRRAHSYHLIKHLVLKSKTANLVQKVNIDYSPITGVVLFLKKKYIYT